MMIEPEPTDVMPTMNPATAPRTIVGIGRRRTSGRVGRAAPSPSGSRFCHIWNSARATRPGRGGDAARVPSSVLRTESSSSPRGWRLMNQAPRNADGMDPMHSSLTSAEVDRAVAEVHERAGRLHDEARDEVARDRRQGIGLEEEHEHRRHQGAAAHPGQPDDDAHEQPAEGEREVNRHSAPGARARSSGTGTTAR